MAKRKNRSKRSLTSLPKGLPVRGTKGGKNDETTTNPFDVSHRQKRGKFQVHNRSDDQQPQKLSALAQSLQRRKDSVKEAFKSSKKANVFVDQRIGEYSEDMTADQQNLARLVKERTRRSKRNSKFSLNDEADNDTLTHRGAAIDPNKPVVILSDDEDDGGNLDAADTSMHFGGGATRNNEDAMYGSGGHSMSQLYAARKPDLDDFIARRKELKAEKLQSKEAQADTFAAMDNSFSDFKDILQFRDKEHDIRKHLQDKRQGKLSEEEQEMADWDKEMKQYLHADRKVKATDRTKTHEEIAKEAADLLHERETRRLARMNGDFDDDDFSDVSDDDNDDNKRRKRVKRKHDNPEALSDDDDGEDDNKLSQRFTADGLVHINKDGVVVGKVGEDAKEAQPAVQLASELPGPLTKGTRIEASYRASEQHDGNESWYTAVVLQVHKNGGEYTYDVDYDDGDSEEGVEPSHIRVEAKSDKELDKEREKQENEAILKRKRQKAAEKAR
jgi:nucleolar protein 14